MALPSPAWSETLVTDAIGITAAGAITAKRFVGYDGNLCGAGKAAVGVAYWDAASGEQITMYGPGNIVLVEAGGSVTAGDPVGSDSTGRAVTAAALAVAADGITVDASKLTINNSSTPVTSTAANGAIIGVASGFLTVAAGAITGGAVPVAVNGIALATAPNGAGDFIPVLVK
jgi:hypothetical protein